MSTRGSTLAFALASVSLFLARRAHAQNCEATPPGRCLYVATDGSRGFAPTDDCQNPPALDCNTGGTLDAPWGSIATAAECARPGDVVYVRAGTYGTQCTTYPNMATYSLWSRHSGTAAGIITFKAYPAEHVTLTGGITLNAPPIDGNEGDYIAVEGFEVTGQPIEVYGAHDVVRNNDVHDVNFACSDNDACIRLDQDSSYALVEGNVVHGCFERDGGDDFRNVGGFAFNCAGIKFMHGVAHHTVRGNEIFDEPAGMHLKYPGEGMDDLIEGNTFHDVRVAVYGSNNGFTLRNNVVYGAETGVTVGGRIDPNTGGFDVTIENNTFADCDEGVSIDTGNAVVRGNIFSSAAAMYQTFVFDGYTNDGSGFPNMDLSPLTMDHNCFFTAGNVYRYGHDGQPNYYYDLPMVQGTYRQELTSVFGDPRFVNPTAHDYRPAPDGPCANFGAAVSPPDAGDAGRDGGACTNCNDAGVRGDAGAMDGSSGGDGATAGDAGTVGDAGTRDDRGGCGCSVPGRRVAGTRFTVLGAAVLAALVGRRRRGRPVGPCMTPVGTGSQ